MKSMVDQLPPHERELLANWYDTPSYIAFKHLLEQERLNTATKLVDIDPKDVVAIARHQGRADNCKQLNLILKNNYQTHVRVNKKGDKSNGKFKSRKKS